MSSALAVHRNHLGRSSRGSTSTITATTPRVMAIASNHARPVWGTASLMRSVKLIAAAHSRAELWSTLGRTRVREMVRACDQILLFSTGLLGLCCHTPLIECGHGSGGVGGVHERGARRCGVPGPGP